MAGALHRSSSTALECVQLINCDIEHIDIGIGSLECDSAVVVSYVVRIRAVRDSCTLCGSKCRAELFERRERRIEINTALDILTVDRTCNASCYCCACALLPIEITDIIIAADCENTVSVARVNVVHCGLIVVAA